MQQEHMHSTPSTRRRPYGPLKFLAVANRVNVSLVQLASAAGCARSTVHSLGQYGNWPKRIPISRDGITELLRKKGATDAELETLFEVQEVVGSGLVQPLKPLSTTAQTTAEEEIMLMGKKTLTPDARKQFGLFKNPFDGDVTSEDEMFVSPEIRFIREACWQTAIGGSFVAVVGESGAGKTTILGDLKDRIISSHHPVIIVEPSVLGMEERDTTGKTLKAGDILRALVCTLDPRAIVQQSLEARTRQFIKLLQDSVTAGNNHLLVIEEAHSLPIPTLKHLKRLHEKTRLGRRAALGILLLAQPELHDKLNEKRHDVREVYQRCEMLDLQPLDADLPEYIAHRAKLVDKSAGDFFTEDGLAEIRNRLTVQRRVAGGNAARSISLTYPLAVNNLVVACMNLAADLGSPLITKDIVRRAA